MPKYKVYVPYLLYVVVNVNAEDQEDAIDRAQDYAPVAYCGNGGCDKLVGISESNASVEVTDRSVELFTVPDIEVEEIE